MKTADYVGISIALCLLTFLVGISIGGCIIKSDFRQSAIKAGVAKWVISDSENGGVEFIWITEK